MGYKQLSEGDAVAVVLGESVQIVERTTPTLGPGSFSGSRFERLVMADGRRLFVKHLPPEGDWITRSTDGAGRMRLLWESGTVERIPATIDHTILGVVARSGQESIIMRDVSDNLITSIDAPVPEGQLRQLLHGLAEFHAAFKGYQLAGLCSLTARYRMFSPKMRAEDMGPNPNPMNDALVAGWQTFSEVAPADVVQAIRVVHDKPEQLADELLASAPVTLLYGDFRIGNIGLNGQRVVAIDWGELTALGPAEFDVAWFASVPGRRVHWTADDVFDLYSEQAARRLDPRALDLACIGALAMQGGWYGALLARDDEIWQAYGRRQLGWWSDRVRRALSTWSPA